MCNEWCKEFRGWCKSFTRTEILLAVLEAVLLLICIGFLIFLILHFIACSLRQSQLQNDVSTAAPWPLPDETPPDKGLGPDDDEYDEVIEGIIKSTPKQSVSTVYNSTAHSVNVTDPQTEREKIHKKIIINKDNTTNRHPKTTKGVQIFINGVPVILTDQTPHGQGPPANIADSTTNKGTTTAMGDNSSSHHKIDVNKGVSHGGGDDYEAHRQTVMETTPPLSGNHEPGGGLHLAGHHKKHHEKTTIDKNLWESNYKKVTPESFGLTKPWMPTLPGGYISITDKLTPSKSYGTTLPLTNGQHHQTTVTNKGESSKPGQHITPSKEQHHDDEVEKQLPPHADEPSGNQELIENKGISGFKTTTDGQNSKYSVNDKDASSGYVSDNSTSNINDEIKKIVNNKNITPNIKQKTNKDSTTRSTSQFVPPQDEFWADDIPSKDAQEDGPTQTPDTSQHESERNSTVTRTLSPDINCTWVPLRKTEPRTRYYEHGRHTPATGHEHRQRVEGRGPKIGKKIVINKPQLHANESSVFDEMVYYESETRRMDDDEAGPAVEVVSFEGGEAAEPTSLEALAFDDQSDGEESRDAYRRFVLALVKLQPGRDVQFGCTLTAITQFWTLTAASCIDAVEEVDSLDSFLMMEGYGAVAGRGGGVARAVADVRVHPMYQGANRSHDLAALRAAAPLAAARVAVLPSLLDYYTLTIAERFTILGFGGFRNVESNALGRALREVHVYSLPARQCAAAGGVWALRHLARGSAAGAGAAGAGAGAGPLCAGVLYARGAPCLYCAGSPLLRGAVLFGVMSDGQQCAVACEPTFYVNMAVVRDWIDTVLLPD